MRRLSAVIFLACSLAACAPNSASTYTESEMGRAATVIRGKIIAVRDVTLQGDSSGAGGLTGAVAGGAAGTMVSNNPALAVAGAAGGALAAALYDKSAGKDASILAFNLEASDGFESGGSGSSPTIKSDGDIEDFAKSLIGTT
jgi:outer membrane lipoprotein SlyB